jgi:hypothetical protein
MKTCKECSQEKALADFSFDKAANCYKAKCKSCCATIRRNRTAEYRQLGKCSCGRVCEFGGTCNTCREYNKKHNASLKLEAINAYGGPKCECCGDKNIEFLSIDHIDGGGCQHRKELFGTTHGSIYGWLKKSGYPEGYRVLCMNCNFSLGHYGYCPHRKEDRQ